MNQREERRVEREGAGWETYDVLYKSQMKYISAFLAMQERVPGDIRRFYIHSGDMLEEAEWMGNDTLRQVARPLFRIYTGVHSGAETLHIPAFFQFEFYQNLLKNEAVDREQVLGAFRSAITTMPRPVSQAGAWFEYAHDYSEGEERAAIVTQSLKMVQEGLPAVSLFPVMADARMMRDFWGLVELAKKYKIEALASVVMPYLEQMTDPAAQHIVFAADADVLVTMIRNVADIQHDPEKDSALVAAMVEQNLAQMTGLARRVVAEMTMGTFEEEAQLPPFRLLVRPRQYDERNKGRLVFSHHDTRDWLSKRGYTVFQQPDKSTTEALVEVYENFQDAANAASQYFIKTGELPKAFEIWRQIDDYDEQTQVLIQLQKELLRRKHYEVLRRTEQEYLARWKGESRQHLKAELRIAYEWYAEELTEKHQSRDFPSLPDWVQERCFPAYETDMRAFTDLVKDVARLPRGHVMRSYVTQALTRRLAEAKRFMRSKQVEIIRKWDHDVQVQVDESIQKIRFTPDARDGEREVPNHWKQMYQKNVLGSELEVMQFLSTLLYWQRFS